MLKLDEVLTGVQQAEERQTPRVPPTLSQVAYGEAVIDSRQATPGCLFVALSGEKVDGHRFLADAVQHGACAALVRREQAAHLDPGRPFAVGDASGAGLEEATPATVLLIAVDDPLAALQRLAAYHRGLFAPKVIGITGSVGKTSTKEVTAAVLRRRFSTLKNPRSYNTESTLPIALLQLEAHHDVAVLEMGAYGPGDISLLAGIARPHIGIVTNIGPSHMERMGSLETVAQTKSELVQALPSDGYAILNVDDERVRAMADITSGRPLFYGLNSSADLYADEIESRGLGGIAFRAHYAGDAVKLKLPLLGRHSVHTALAAAAAGLLLGLGWDAIVDGLRDESAQLRLLAVPSASGATLIDDTYNASPASSLAALNLLAELDRRRIVVLGDMLELGAIEEEAHRVVGRRVAEVADMLISVGRRARWIADEARLSGMSAGQVTMLETNAEAIELLGGLIRSGDNVLIKGSRGAAMEGIVAALQQPPSQTLERSNV
ncbi:MAG TPA: UDP-N-acetylmuramoyl-tripeptide--D-alanyl-D-alanine ligase [Roseiflexaceae bacterium]|nr:UDP-N-acetylmuramoyl-tripeptide--D-alanyl-D-alanine ligase [Roseiflexaceae bacterium]